MSCTSACLRRKPSCRCQYLLCELLMSDALPTCRALPHVSDESLLAAANIFDVEHAHRADCFQFFSILARDIITDDPNVGHQAVEGSADRRPLGMCLALALFTHNFHLDFLTRSHFSN